jgi:outer membrane protein assembly factor BamB
LLNKKEVGKERTDRYPGTRSSVTVNDGKLYIFNALGHFYCLDETTLNVVWQKDFLKDFDGRNIGWGLTENALIVGEKIFLTPGGKKNNIVALNKTTGALIWSSTGTGMPSSYCSPLYISDQSVPMVVTSFEGPRGEGRVYNNTLNAFNANTGEMLWSHTIPSENDINPNAPLYSDGMIFFSTGYRGGSWMLRLKDGGKAVEQVWRHTADNQHHGPVKVGDHVYTTSHNNGRGFHCIDWKTGETKYREANHPQSSMIFADGMLYCYNDNGTVNLVKPNPEKYELVSSFKVTLGTDQHWAHPVIHRGVLYIRHGDALMAYKVK